MTDVQPILDYASPRPRGKVRLPAHSTLDVRTDSDSVEVVERLDGRVAAVGAILFAAVMLAVMTSVVQSEVRYAMRRTTPTVPLLLAGACLAGGAVVMGMVINNTWRRTILSANADGVRLRFFAPLSGSRRYAWDADRIEAVRVEPTGPAAALAGVDLARSSALCELQIHPVAGAVAHLFSDHEAFRLVPIRESILRVLGTPSNPPTPPSARAVLR